MSGRIRLAWPGYSGSILIDCFGHICGLYYANATSWIGAEGEEIQNSTASLGMTMADIRLGVKFQANDESVELGLPGGD